MPIMSPDEYRAVLLKLELTQRGTARFLDIGERTSREWAAGDSKISSPTTMLLRLIAKLELTPERVTELTRDPIEFEGKSMSTLIGELKAIHAGILEAPLDWLLAEEAKREGLLNTGSSEARAQARALRERVARDVAAILAGAWEAKDIVFTRSDGKKPSLHAFIDSLARSSYQPADAPRTSSLQVLTYFSTRPIALLALLDMVEEPVDPRAREFLDRVPSLVD